MELAEVPLDMRCRAVLDVLSSEPMMSVWRRAELLMTALWPPGALIPEPPPRRVEWKRRGRASTPAERAEVLEVLDEGWTVGQVADATGWTVAQVTMWRKRGRAD